MRAYGKRSSPSPGEAISALKQPFKRPRPAAEALFDDLMMQDAQAVRKDFLNTLTDASTKMEVKSSAISIDDVVDDMVVCPDSNGPPKSRSPLRNMIRAGPSPARGKVVASELRTMRQENLSVQSASSLLLLALQRKPHPQLRSLQAQLDLEQAMSEDNAASPSLRFTADRRTFRPSDPPGKQVPRLVFAQLSLPCISSRFLATVAFLSDTHVLVPPPSQFVGEMDATLRQTVTALLQQGAGSNCFAFPISALSFTIWVGRP